MTEEIKNACDMINQYIEAYELETPVKLTLDMVALRDRDNPDGNQKRYFKVYLDTGDERSRVDISDLAATASNNKLSKAHDTYNTVLEHGCGMDMCFKLVNDINYSMCEAGHKNVVDGQYYRLLNYERENDKIVSR